MSLLNNQFNRKIFSNLNVTSFSFSGAYRWIDIMSMGTSEYQEKLEQMETETSVHDICNIQFTSVSLFVARSPEIIK